MECLLILSDNRSNITLDMVHTFLLFDTITNDTTVKFMQRDIITSTITWHLGLVGSNNFGEYTSFSPFTLALPAQQGLDNRVKYPI